MELLPTSYRRCGSEPKIRINIHSYARVALVTTEEIAALERADTINDAAANAGAVADQGDEVESASPARRPACPGDLPA